MTTSPHQSDGEIAAVVLAAHNLDGGADFDIEDEANMGAPLGDFVTALAWQQDQVSGGALANRATPDYPGETSMADETEPRLNYGGAWSGS